jgi:hypothetical protein
MVALGVTVMFNNLDLTGASTCIANITIVTLTPLIFTVQ